MKYTVVKRIHFSHANDYVTVIKEAETLEDAMKFKVAAEMVKKRRGPLMPIVMAS